ncbi:hypothetical protein, partial [Klebsiella pneumoniae]|uniref:hypothetical protein n=1 Tax=Klebsiella pneumoniae TaxID=573 RepID=UPI0029D9AEE7
MMSLWDALRMNMMISYQELVRTFLRFSLRTGFHPKCLPNSYQIVVQDCDLTAFRSNLPFSCLLKENVNL